MNNNNENVTAAIRAELLGGIGWNPEYAKTVIQKVSELTGIPVNLILSRDRHEPVVMARWACMWLIRYTAGLSTKEIGNVFGRDHTSVIHALNAVNDRREINPKYRAALDFAYKSITTNP